MTLTVKHNVTTSRANSSAYDISATAWDADHLVTGISNAVLDWVSVKDYGATGDGSTDDTVAIQAAIDAAFAASVGVVYMPAGRYKTSAPLYLDPPGNLRSNFANPPTFGFSMTLTGDESPGQGQNNNTQIRPTHHVGAALYVGPGQAMCVRCIGLISDETSYRANWDSTFIAIAICGGSGGSIQSLFEKIQINSFYGGIWTAVNGNGNLGETNTFIKCHVYNCYIAFNIQESQNFCNDFYSCQGGGTIGLQNFNTKTVSVCGGNWSIQSGVSNAFNVSSTSVLSTTAFGNVKTYTFTTVIASPDIYIPNVYNSFMFNTTSFGVVPCTLTSWNAGTSTATFQIYNQYSSAWGSGIDLSNTGQTDFQNELRACAKVYCAERAKTFLGASFDIRSIDIENDACATTVFEGANFFGSDVPSNLSNVFCNFDPSFSVFQPDNSPSDAQLAKYLCMQAFGFITLTHSQSVHVHDCHFGAAHPLIIDIISGNLYVSRVKGLSLVNVRNPLNDAGVSYFNAQNTYTAGGMFDLGYFLSVGAMLGVGSYLGDFYGGSDSNNTFGPGPTRHFGFVPDPRDASSMFQTDLATLSGILPAITSTNIPYKHMWGGKIYQILPDNLASTNLSIPTRQVVSDHAGWTYGQDLTTTVVPGLSWSYKAKSKMVYFGSVAQMYLMKPGLTVILNDGSSDITYTVMEVYPGLKYMVVGQTAAFAFQSTLSGATTTTVVTGSLIKQSAFRIHPLQDTTRNVQFPAAGFNITLADFDTMVILDNAALLANGTLNMATNPPPGARVAIVSRAGVTALTIVPTAGSFNLNAPATLAAGKFIFGVYDPGTTSWYWG